MELETIGVALGGVAAGGVVAAAGGAWWWCRKLKLAALRIAKLDQARQFADQQGAQVRKQIEQLQHEMAELRVQASRARPHHVSPPMPSRQELEDMLLRDSEPPSTAEGFATTQIMPRKR